MLNTNDHEFLHYLSKVLVFLCTTRFPIRKFYPQSVFFGFYVYKNKPLVRISECSINRLVFITKTESVYCVVLTESLSIIQVNLLFEGLSKFLLARPY
jgi:hypothetical protein